MSTRNWLNAVFVAWLGLSAGSCTNVDYYSQVAPFCMQHDPKMGELIYPPTTQTYLDKTCKEKLEGVLNQFYDADSFASAPTGFKDKVTEAFQAIIAYPLVIPEQNLIFGVAPQDAGALPVSYIQIFQEGANPNQALFNFILGQIDLIRYGGDDPGGATAKYLPRFSTKYREIVLYSGFWKSSNPMEMFRNPFVRAGTLAHEAFHGDLDFHINCSSDATDGNSGTMCDSSLGGAYGFGVAYFKYLLHGSATCAGPSCVPPIGKLNVLIIGLEMCLDLKSHMNFRFDELEAVLGPVVCADSATYNWTMKLENLPAWETPSPSSSPSSAPLSLAHARSGTTQDPLDTATIRDIVLPDGRKLTPQSLNCGYHK